MALLNEIKVKHNWHPNTSLEFTATGIWMRVSLNIPKSLRSKLSPNNVTKGKEHYVYALKAFVQSDMVNKNTLEAVQTMLLENCMRNIRVAKRKMQKITE